MPTHPLFVLSVLCLNVVICEWLATKPYFRHLGTALLVILLTAIEANLGVIPASSPPSIVYDGIFTYVAPISIFLLMLSVNLKSIRRAGPSMIGLFLVGALGTVLGVTVAMKLVDAAALLGEKYYALAGMLTGTYKGGSLNFNAVALHYGMAREGPPQFFVVCRVVRGIPKGDSVLQIKGRRKAGPVERPASSKAEYLSCPPPRHPDLQIGMSMRSFFYTSNSRKAVSEMTSTRLRGGMATGIFSSNGSAEVYNGGSWNSLQSQL